MAKWEQQQGQAQGGAPTVHLKPKLRLVLFPGETVRGGVTYGHIYVEGGNKEAYEIAAGPPPGQGSSGPRGHTAGSTPAGKYVLSDKEHHVTLNWPMSTIPWGAQLEKKADGEVYYSIKAGSWKKVTGPDGVFTKAC